MNHTYNFVGPRTHAHTQHIESIWRPLNIFEFLKRREVKRNEGSYLEMIIDDIRQIKNDIIRTIQNPVF